MLQPNEKELDAMASLADDPRMKEILGCVARARAADALGDEVQVDPILSAMNKGRRQALGDIIKSIEGAQATIIAQREQAKKKAAMGPSGMRGIAG